MNNSLEVNKSVEIKAEPNRVWSGLTDPEKVKQYFFGTNIRSDWEKGSPIIFSGEFVGQSFEDKGTILEVDYGRSLKYDYWSGFSGLEDKPENYSTVTYTLEDLNGVTKLRLNQQGFASKEARDHSESAWEMVLTGLKELLEKS
jgi:uncharacterized protein YndB with AHSA1/START domain